MSILLVLHRNNNDEDEKANNRRREADELFCRIVGRARASEERIGELLSDSSDWKEHKRGEQVERRILASPSKLQPTPASYTIDHLPVRTLGDVLEQVSQGARECSRIGFLIDPPKPFGMAIRALGEFGDRWRAHCYDLW